MLNKRNQWKAQAKYLNRLLRQKGFAKHTVKCIRQIGLPMEMRTKLTYKHIEKWGEERK